MKEFNKLTEKELIKAAQDGVTKELERKLSEGKPVSYWDSQKKKVYRITPSGEKVYA